MKFRIALFLLALFVFVSTGNSQTQLTIRKKTSMKIPGMPDMSNMPGMSDPNKGQSTTVYLKGTKMRTDSKYQGNKEISGGGPTVQTMIIQCEKRRSVQFNNKKKKYYVESLSGPTAATANATTKQPVRKGGYVTVTGGVTDTGERAKLFGFDARHLKETYTMTPSKNACQKQGMTIEIEGWYADIPEFSCPTQRKPREFQMDGGCFDDVDFQVKGGITGVALKEIKKMTIDDQVIIIEEEATSISRDPISDSMFEPPADYKAANTLKEVEDDSSDDASNNTAAVSTSTPVNNVPSKSTQAPTFAVPVAGIERPTGPKADNMIRVGIAKVKVLTPESKKDPDAGIDIASAATLSLIESLKAENIEAIELNTEFPENECSERGCDYIFYANVNQKRGGGGMFGKMVAMGAISMASVFVPGIGGMIASTVASQVMSQTMMKSIKAKDEITLDYKVMTKEKAVFTQGSTKSKSEKDGDDILTPQLQKASASVITEINKKKAP